MWWGALRSWCDLHVRGWGEGGGVATVTWQGPILEGGGIELVWW